nr:MAG TPA: hypothetical protein [Caudoviricetes sp.]
MNAKLTSKIKMRVGIVYSTPKQDEMINSMIEAAQAALINAGWRRSDFEEDVQKGIKNEQAIESIAKIVKRNLNTESDHSAIDPMLIFDIGQNRGV